MSGDVIKFYTLQPDMGVQRGQIATAAVITCAICDHIVDGMGGPAKPSICPECFELLRTDSIKMERSIVEAEIKDRNVP